MNGTQDLNLNATECLVSKMDFGAQTITNICTGAVHTVSWGTADWTLAIGLCAFGATLMIMFLGLGLSVLRDA